MDRSATERRREGFRAIFLSQLFQEPLIMDDDDRKRAVRFIEKQVGLLPGNNSLEVRLEITLDSITYRERETLKLLYGIGDGFTYSYKEVAKIFRQSEDRVREVESKALNKLRDPVRILFLSGFLQASRHVRSG